MEPDTLKIWTRPEVHVSVGKMIVESLGVDEGTVTDDAALVRDLGAESIDFLDMSFKCQQIFGVDLPMRLIQDRRIEWRDLTVLAKRSEEHTSELQSPCNIVCRLLLGQKKTSTPRRYQFSNVRRAKVCRRSCNRGP